MIVYILTRWFFDLCPKIHNLMKKKYSELMSSLCIYQRYRVYSTEQNKWNPWPCETHRLVQEADKNFN